MDNSGQGRSPALRAIPTRRAVAHILARALAASASNSRATAPVDALPAAASQRPVTPPRSPKPPRKESMSMSKKSQRNTDQAVPARRPDHPRSCDAAFHLALATDRPHVQGCTLTATPTARGRHASRDLNCSHDRARWRRPSLTTRIGRQSPIDVVAPATNGFLRATMRGLARQRLRQDADHEIPFRLTAGPTGGLTLEDPTTGRRVEMEAFGIDQRGRSLPASDNDPGLKTATA